MGRRAGGGWRGAITAVLGLAVAIGGAGCGRPDPVDHQALPGQAVGLAAIATTASSASGASLGSTAVAVTVPALTNAGTIANLTSPAVTVPGSTTPMAAPASTPAPAPTAAAEPTPAAEPAPAPAPAPVTVVPPYTTVLGWTGDGLVAYLTFDDGPGPATGQILDILAAKGVAATFCVVGQKVAENPEMTRRIADGGHTLCNHSWDHPTGFNTLAPDVLAGQIGRTQDAVIAATGHTPRYLRAPEGSFGDPAGSVHQAAQQARTLLLGWAVDSKDWTKPGAAIIVANVLGTVSPGAIILMHDAGGTDRQQTLDALPGVIDGLRAAGYTLLPLPPDPAG
ncbi:polysaccharide deacetylase family protein [Nakamurella sp.]|uniref:polysaccharide deacetylase family protein n=1 Tax=Nakamurella sp. TaxID=1869182 RepID=UPI003784D410